MALLVQKFGGTSVGSIERIEAVADKLASYKDQGHTLVVVVSAMSGETNRLTELAQQVDPQARGRELDVLLTTGEQVTIALLAMALEKRGYPARSYTGGQVKITTDSTHNKARIKSIDHERITNDLENGRIVVVAGFQGVDEHNNITTLGRGGSDTTGVALAAALKADECQIFTDVDGVYTTDPRVEPEARRLETITFEEMLEMASLGSKVLQIRSVEFAGKYNVPISDANIEVDMILQNVSADGTTDFTFTVHRNDFETAFASLQQTARELKAREVSGNNKIVKISIVGVGMRSHAGIASRMFEVLANEGINILMISTSEIKISVVVGEEYLELGVRALHEGFDLKQRS